MKEKHENEKENSYNFIVEQKLKTYTLRYLKEKYSKYISSAFQIRNNCDYDDFFIVSKEEAIEQYEHAYELYEAVKKFLD